jgi:hypothetical protein
VRRARRLESGEVGDRRRIVGTHGLLACSLETQNRRSGAATKRRIARRGSAISRECSTLAIAAAQGAARPFIPGLLCLSFRAFPLCPSEPPPVSFRAAAFVIPSLRVARSVVTASLRSAVRCHPESARSAGEGSRHIDALRFLAFGSE